MWDIILSVISVIGILFLVLLVLLLFLTILVLFYPITYGIQGIKSSEETWLRVKINWLFGLFRVRYYYPEPGNIVVKILWKNIFVPGEKNRKGSKTENKPENKSEEIVTKETQETESVQKSIGEESKRTDETSEEKDEKAAEKAQSGISGKIHKIKYTIQKIYDKIKEIWENLSYYSELLREEDTLGLWKHVKLRLGKIWKSIRPRHIRADILFGTGAPDTTGYLLGVYGMLSPSLGPKVNVTPDFTQAILQGEAEVSGHVTTFGLAVNGLKLLLDKRLHLFLKKLKRNDKTSKQTKSNV